MAVLEISPGESLTLDEGDFFQVGTLLNEGVVDGDGDLGLFWASPIEGDAEAVTCGIVEEEIPTFEISWKVLPQTLIVSCQEIGADLYAVALDDSDPEPFPASLTKTYAGLIPASVHTVTATATNSRGHTLTVVEDVTITVFLSVYSAAQDVCIQPDETRGANAMFMARLVDPDADLPLRQVDVDSISLSAWKHVRNIDGCGRIAVPGFEQVDVPTETILPAVVDCEYWERDNYGINFIHVPDQQTAQIFPEPGAYEVEYSFTLVDGNPINLAYEIYVE